MCKVIFILAIKEKPEESEKTFFEVKVEKIGEHEHSETAKQLRGIINVKCMINEYKLKYFR